jgi:hypothetical protein
MILHGETGVRFLDGPGRWEAAGHQCQIPQISTPPVRQTAIHFRDDARAAQCAADVSRLVPHSLLRLLQPEDRLTLGEGDPHPLPGRVRLFARECENVAQEGQSPAMPNGRCRMHGGSSPGAPVGNKNALKHGLYTAEAIARRRSLAELIRAARQLIA